MPSDVSTKTLIKNAVLLINDFPAAPPAPGLKESIQAQMKTGLGHGAPVFCGTICENEKNLPKLITAEKFIELFTTLSSSQHAMVDIDMG